MYEARPFDGEDNIFYADNVKTAREIQQRVGYFDEIIVHKIPQEEEEELLKFIEEMDNDHNTRDET